LNRVRARLSGGVAAQAGNALAAAWTARSTSAVPAKATRRDRSPVAGLLDVAQRPLVPSTPWPSM